MTKKINLILLVLFSLVTKLVYGQVENYTSTWDYDIVITSQADWENIANWGNAGFPDSDDNVLFNGARVVIDYDLTLSDANFSFGGGTSDFFFTIKSGRTLTVGSLFANQNQPFTIESNATLIVNDSMSVDNAPMTVNGQLTVKGGLNVKNGSLNVSDTGSLTAEGSLLLNGSASLNIDGTATIKEDLVITGSGDLDVNLGGDLTTEGDFYISGGPNVTIDGTYEVKGDFFPSESAEGKITGGGDIIGIEGDDLPGFTGDATLYLFLVSFHVDFSNINDLYVRWTTLSEYQVDYFDVEGSFDGVNYESVAKVSSVGDHERIQEYTIEVGYFKYFRLKIVNMDRSYSYSKVITHSFLPAAHIKVYPNPVIDQLNIEFNREGNQRVEIFNSIGELEYTLKTDKTEIKIEEVATWERGVYLVVISDEMRGSREVKKIFVSK